SAQYKYFGELNGDLIVIGGSLSVAGTGIRNVARWNGVSWSGLGTPPDFPYAVQDFHGDLYIAFDGSLGGATSIAGWNGAAWVGLGTGIPNGYVNAMCVHRDSLVVGGDFPDAGGVPAASIAFWDGVAWHPIGAGF